MFTLRVTRPDGEVDTYVGMGLSWGIWDAGDLRVWSPNHIAALYKKGQWVEVAKETPLEGVEGLVQVQRWRPPTQSRADNVIGGLAGAAPL